MREGHGRVVAVATLAAMLVMAPGAVAQTAGVTQEAYDDRGNPVVVANSTPDGSLGTVSWSVCPPGGAACTAAGTGPVLTAGPQPAGTVFEAAVDYADRRTTTRSRTWGGQLTGLTPPSLTGVAGVGATVSVGPASWLGGWGDGDYDELRLQACRTRGGQDCTTVTAPRYGFENPVTIDGALAGKYLFAVAARRTRDTVYPAIGYLSPAAIPVLTPGQAVMASDPIGPVRANWVDLDSRATLSKRRATLGIVHCLKRCDASVRLIRKGKVHRQSGRVMGATRIVASGLSGPGRWKVQVRIAGRLIASGSVRVTPD